MVYTFEATDVFSIRYILDVAFSKLRDSRVREIETAPRFPDHALIFSPAFYSRATPSI